MLSAPTARLAPETGQPPICHLSSLTIVAAAKFLPSFEEATAICRKSPGRTCRQLT
jgi:hypothetical protein